MPRRTAITVPNARNAQLMQSRKIRPFRRNPIVAPVVTITITGTYVAGQTVGDVATSVTGANSGSPPLDNGITTIEVNGTPQGAAYVLVAGESLVARYSYTHPSGDTSVISAPSIVGAGP